MEYIEGPSLAERIGGGRIPLVSRPPVHAAVCVPALSACLLCRSSRTRWPPAFSRKVITLTLRWLGSLFVSHWPNSSVAWRNHRAQLGEQAGVDLVGFCEAAGL